jgi:addiction module HigA family antidote
MNQTVLAIRVLTHPGAILREDVLPKLGISSTELAAHLCVSQDTIDEILSEEKGITPEIASKLGEYLGNGQGIWIRMQQAHDASLM